MSLTSLIDVIFLLLLFFMLSSTFSRYAEIELVAAAPAADAAEAPPLFLRLAPGELSLNGEIVALGALAERLAQQAEGETRQVLVSLGEGTRAQRLADLLGVLRGVPGISPTVLGGGA